LDQKGDNIGMIENRIEKNLIKKVEKLGGKCLKFVSPGLIGVPDRIVLTQGGNITFIELKAPGKQLRKIQTYRCKQIRDLGFKVITIDTIKKVDLFIEEVKNNEI